MAALPLPPSPPKEKPLKSSVSFVKSALKCNELACIPDLFLVPGWYWEIPLTSLYMLLLCHHDRIHIIMLERRLKFELFWVNIIVFV